MAAPTETHLTDPSLLPYRVNVGLCLFNRVGLVFCAERRDNPGEWQMPQGGIQKGEEKRVAALRELREEVGTDKAEIIAEAPEILRYDFPDHLLCYPNGAFRGKYRGQEQTWFALRFTGQDSDIDLSGAADSEPPEFVQWRWEKLDALPELIVPFKRPVYERVVQFFAPIAEKLKND